MKSTFQTESPFQFEFWRIGVTGMEKFLGRVSYLKHDDINGKPEVTAAWRHLWLGVYWRVK